MNFNKNYVDLKTSDTVLQTLALDNVIQKVLKELFFWVKIC